MSKRKRFDEWNCPVCLSGLDDSVVPAVLNGCPTIAHVVCMACATALLRHRAAATCPECRAPFVSARPIAAFVDVDDPAVAGVLAAKSRAAQTMAERVEQLGIEHERVRLRVVNTAERLDAFLRSDRFIAAGPSSYWWARKVSRFDRDQVSLTVTAAKTTMSLRPARLAELRRRLSAITDQIVPHLQALFVGRVTVENGHANQSLRPKPGYMALRLGKRAP